MTELIKGRVMVSGGLNPLHVGHLAFFREAARQGNELIVAVECDAWVAKKHPVLMPHMHRIALVSACKGVTLAVANNRDDGDCSSLITQLRPEIYCVGPDHFDDDFPEKKTCCDLGVVPARLNTPKLSSTEIVKRLLPRYANPPIIANAMISRVSHENRLEVVLGHRYGKPIDKGWDLPGGFVELGETLEDAAKREAKEELGVSLSRCDYLWSRVGVYEDGRQVVCVYFDTYTPDKLVADDKEFDQYRWFASAPTGMHAAVDHEAMVEYFAGHR